MTSTHATSSSSTASPAENAGRSRWLRLRSWAHHHAPTAARIVRESVGSSTALALLAAAALIAMNELNRLIGELLTADGSTHSLTGVIGFTPFAELSSWEQWRHSPFPVHIFIAAHTAFDLLFILCYSLLLLRLFAYAEKQRNREIRAAHRKNDPNPPRVVSVTTASTLIFVLAGLDLVEDGLVYALVYPPTQLADSWLFSVLPVYTAGVTIAKWAATAVLVLYAVLSSLVGTTVRAFVRRALLALYAQRLSLIVVGALGIVSLVSAPGVLEQVSDVYRGWFDYPSEGTGALVRVDPAPMLVALAAFALTGLSLFALGRQRAWHYAELQKKEDGRRPGYTRAWYILAAVVFGVGLIGLLWSGGRNVDWGLTLAFVGVAAGIPFVSSQLRKRVEQKNLVLSPPLLRSDVSERFEWVLAAGDLLVAAWIAIWALGPFKSLIAPLFLYAAGEFEDTKLRHYFPWLVAAEVVLFVLAIGLPVWFRRKLVTGVRLPRWITTGLDKVGALFDRGPVRAHQPKRRFRRAMRAAFAPQEPSDNSTKKLLGNLGLVIVFASIVFIGFDLVFPAQIAYWAGPVGILVMLVGCWTTIVGGMILQLGHRKPLELFQVLRLRATPIVTLLIVVPAVVSFVEIAPGLHAIHINDENAASDRLDLRRAFNEWYGNQVGCERTLPNGTTFYPLTLIAAEGGGIRAATWTVDVVRALPALADVGSCAAGATFISSGASGGSIGLASFRTLDQPTTPEEKLDQIALTATNDTVNLGTPRALAADVGGMLNGDLVGSLTGIRVPSYDNLNDAWVWQDRTAQQELTWSTDAPEFALPYTVKPQVPTGFTIFNSTDSLSTCKVVVSQIDLTQIEYATDDGTKARPDCNGTQAGLSNTVDLQDYIGECLFDVTWATAAELSARFPFVSPAGRISNATLPTGCNSVSDMQLVDGGLSDNTGLGTISDLAPDLMNLVAAKNTVAESQGTPLIIPILMFITNEPGTDVISAVQGSRPDLLIPLEARSEAPLSLLTPASWLTRLGEQLNTGCPPTASLRCMDAVREVRKNLPGSIAVVSPATEPSVSVPLGWTLSSFSRSRLYQESLDQTECRFADVAEDTCLAGGAYGRLGDILDLFRLTPMTK